MATKEIIELPEETTPDPDDFLEGQKQAGGDNSSYRVKVKNVGASKTGTYTGDGTESQAITGIGFLPKALFITERRTSGGDAVDPYFVTNEIVDDNASGGVIDLGNSKFETDKVLSLDADGFTVDDNGSDEHPNESGTIYNYYAVR